MVEMNTPAATPAPRRTCSYCHQPGHRRPTCPTRIRTEQHERNQIRERNQNRRAVSPPPPPPPVHNVQVTHLPGNAYEITILTPQNNPNVTTTPDLRQLEVTALDRYNEMLRLHTQYAILGRELERARALWRIATHEHQTAEARIRATRNQQPRAQQQLEQLAQQPATVEAECPICLDTKFCRSYKCGHHTCGECTDRMLQVNRHATCSCCRRPIEYNRMGDTPFIPV